MIIPRVPDLEQKEIRAINRLVDKLRPVDTIAIVSKGQDLRQELPILDVASTSNRFTVLRNVQGNADIVWPPLDPAQGYWINNDINEAPTFAFLDKQESATYLTIAQATSSSDHIGQFNAFQKSLFVHLDNLDDLATFNADKSYAKVITPINVTTPWLAPNDHEIHDKIIVNNFYPIGYFTSLNRDISIAQNNNDFWASVEKLPPNEETLTFNFNVRRPVNFIDFSIAQKPINIKVEFNNLNDEWEEITIKDGYEATTTVQYLPSTSNPWAYLEYNFDLVSTDKIRITFTQREERFPQDNPTDYPWSIEVKNLRIIHLVRLVTDFVIDNGSDILGNSFSTDILEYEAANVIDPDDPENYSYWQCQPNPSTTAVEALYFDLRSNSQSLEMSELDLYQMDLMDTQSMIELSSTYSDPVLVDEVYIDPITHGADMHFYYSDDDTPEWDNKLWTPVPEHYVCQRGFHALPTPTRLRYFKVEFSNLTPIPYQFVEYPNVTIRFRRYPTWVQNYFHDIYPTQPMDERIQVVENVSINPIELGYTKFIDALSTGFSEVRDKIYKDHTEELRDFLTDLVATGIMNDNQEVENEIRFFSPLMWQADLLKLVDPQRALGRKVTDLRDGLIDTGWNSELGLPIYESPVPQNPKANITQQREDKFETIMWFPRTVRHEYQILEGRFNNRVAYHVAIKTVGFYRRDYNAYHDTEYYLETLEDEAHIEVNNLTQLDDYRWGV